MNLLFPGAGSIKPDRPFGEGLSAAERSRRVTAVLGPTNTGKTHLAIERMLTHPSGIIGLPLRLLAREVYNRVVEKAGADQVALVTGEEKIKPRNARYWVSTVEAMPRDLDVAFVAIDEIQLAADLDRGHVFTDRLLNRRGREETLLVGASTMQQAIERLLPGAEIISRPRLSTLSFAGDKKLSRLPRRTAIVAFSAEEVYAIAELIRRLRGGAAVVLGALSPRTRNAQVALYQEGDVDYIVATDAIGMGLNLDVDHVAFAGDRKFDGWQYRRLLPAEFGQIAGRAGRHLRDGTFGTTGRCPPFDEDLVEALEEHRFDPVGPLQWRNFDLDFTSIENLQASLEVLPTEAGLSRAPLNEDVLVLEIAARDADVRRQTKTRADVARLWDVCQVPDYRKVSPSAHAELVLALYGFIVRAGRIPDAWFHDQLALFDRTDGDIDTLSARIAQVRTWNYIANRPDWLADPEHWQGVTRQVEDNLSDALHERLAHRFVDRRTSVLMRRLRENAMLEAEITPAGDVMVEGQHVGHLHGFRFTPDPQAAGEAARTLNAAAQKALASEIESRATRVHESVDEALVLANDGTVRWLGEVVAKLTAGEHILTPQARVLADEQLTGPALEMVQKRVDLWVAQHVKKLLGPLNGLESGEGLEGMARGIAFQLAESLGVLERSRVAQEMKTLPQEDRAALRKLGVRFGAYHLFLPLLVKPAPRALAARLWALKHGGIDGVKGLEEVAHFASSGRTSFAATAETPKALYLAAGFRLCGERAVRVDILERLADLIRPAIAYRPGVTPGTPPTGAADGDGFIVTVAMTSLAGCSGEAFASILRSLGYVSDKRPGPAITVPLVPEAPRQALRVTVAAEAASATEEPSPAAADHAQVEAESRPEGSEPRVVSPSAAAIGAFSLETEGEIDAPTIVRPTEAAIEALSHDDEEVETEAAAVAAPAPIEPTAIEPVAVEVMAETEIAGEPQNPAPEVPADAEPQTESVENVAETEASVAPEVASTDSLPEALAPVAEATGEPQVAAEAEEEKPVEPELIEIWRPARHHHAPRRAEDARPRRPRRDEQRSPRPAGPMGDQVAASEPAGTGQVTAEGGATPPEGMPVPSREQRRGGFRDRGPGQNGRRDGRRNTSSDAGPPSGETAGAEAAPAEARRPDGRPGEGRGSDGRGRRPDSRPRPDSRRDHDRDQRRGDRTFATTEKPPSRERQPDPDSPFAKLLALKAELEGRGKKE